MNDLSRLYKHYQQHPVVSTDTRSLPQGALFFALKGERFNGNQYAEAALEKGASLVVVDEPTATPSEQTFRVRNVLETLQALATFHRKQWGKPIIAITGSNGKTTTKELLHAVLQQAYRVQSTPKNYNNHIGVPLTLLGIHPDTELAIVELGDNHSGEIAALCQIALPNFGLVTNVGKDHLEGFGSMEANIAAKAELFDFLAANEGIAFFNQDDAIVAQIAQRVQHTVSYNHTHSPHFVGTCPFLILKDDEGNEFTTELLGKYNLDNIRAAWQIGLHFNVPTAQLRQAIAQYVPKNNRSQLIKTNRNTLLLDAYNANPSSVTAALDSFAEAAFGKPKVVVLGDMHELGSTSEAEHRAIIEKVQAMPFEKVFFCGTQYSALQNNSAQFFPDKAAFIQALEHHPIQHCAVLLKGSRSMALETLVEHL